MEKRIAEIFLATSDGEGIWEEIEFYNIRKGYRFRLFEDREKKEPVLNEKGGQEYIADNDAYKIKDVLTHKYYWTVNTVI